MGVAFIKEITGRDGSKDSDSNKRYRRTWVVRADTPQDGASVVLAAAELPKFNDTYTYLDDSNPLVPVVVTDPAAVVVDVQAVQDNINDPLDWRVIVQYAGVEDPAAQPAEVEYSPTRYQKAILEDVNGVPVMNAAGDYFEGGITVDRTRFTLTIVKAVLTWNPVAALAYEDSLNQTPFLALTHPPGFAPGTCKLTWGAKRVRRAGTTSFYWLRTAVIDIDRDGWKVPVRNTGFREKDPVTGERKAIQNRGVPVPAPVLLADDGTRLPDGDPIPDPFLFDGYVTKDWAGQGLEY